MYQATDVPDTSIHRYLGGRRDKMKINFSHPLIFVLIITLMMSGIMPVVTTADDEAPSESDGNSTVLLPDLIINSLEYSANPNPGDFQDIYIEVKNQGTETSEKTGLVLYINGNSVKGWNVPKLSEGENDYKSYSWIPVSEGTAEIKAVVDKDNLIVESNEENNEKTVTAIVAEEFLPDLIIEDLIPESTEAEKGKPLNVTLKVKNQGIAPSEEVLAEYSINGTIQQDKIRIPVLSEGTETNIKFSLTPDREGQMEIKVLIPSGVYIPESSLDKNAFIRIISVKTILPDLVVESLSLIPEAPKIGDNITFAALIKNKGLADSASSELKYYISRTNETDSGKISVPSIAAGESAEGTFYWVPEEEGNLNVRLVADGGTTIREEDETNNELTKVVSVSKQMTSIDDESSGSSGSSSSSSSNSMGSGVSKEPAKNIEIKELSTRNIASGYHVTYDFLQNVTCITYIGFDPTKTSKKTTATVEVLKGKSIFAKKNPPGRVYKQVNIWVGDKGAGLPDSLKNGYAGFKVDKEWIKNSSVEESNIALLWYDGKWKPLSTEKTGEDENYVYFRAKISGYSCFAISEYTGEEGTVEESADGEGVQETLRSWGREGNVLLNSSAEKEDGMEKKPIGIAKVLLAISLPIFMVLVEYFVLKKKI
jgi:PGF-pre-PGF domain-containing protein